MAIKRLQSVPLSSFQGKNTLQNLTDESIGTLLSGKNVLVLADNQMRKAPGYTLVAANVGPGPVHSVYDFQRDVDQVQTVFVHSGSQIIAMNADGTNQRVMSTTETSTPHVFVKNDFNCYSSNGVTAYRYVDNAGTLTRYNWGVTAPVSAPDVSLAPGTNTLVWGRMYVYCYVSEYTDSLGIQRVHVGSPSPVSAHSGPTASQIVQLTNIEASTDPQVSKIWIFATVDSPLNTSATYFFMAEITNGTTSYGDANPDTALDQTKVAPMENFPAPPSALLAMWQNRIVAAQGNLIQLSGYSEITLGIPEEAWPPDLFFDIPSGSRTVTALTTLETGTLCGIVTQDAWFGLTGTDASSFAMQDRIASPGCIGKFAISTTPFGVAWLSPSQRIFMWTGTGTTTEISSDIMNPYVGTYSMADLSPTDLANARLQWYSFGRLHFLAMLCRTTDAPDANMNLIQLWSIPVKGSSSSGEFTGSSQFFNQIGGIYETDKLPSISLTGTGIVTVTNTPYIYMGDVTGNVYRFPDGFLDSTVPYESNFSTAWQLYGVEGKKRFYWLDIFVESPTTLLNLGGPVENFTVFAAASESPDDEPNWIQLDVQLLPAPEGPSQYALRANLQVPGVNVGRYIRFQVTLPNDNSDEVVLKMVTTFAPIYVGAP